MSRIAVTGASGYLGGRLVPLLLERGHQVKVLTRHPESLRDVPGVRRCRWCRGI
ncbi:NAD(P)H-binding protein [Arthrobacter sp. JCM 19049]|uniref:NAD(P)H-binding protein n=1 Tax=Arthrobacter sp. JCM 19049 TaxID=1460643 RepID=UPI000B2637BB|nr:NAD(P)H-binding protein [Arthrobacter sp. JCM 19049]